MEQVIDGVPVPRIGADVDQVAQRLAEMRDLAAQEAMVHWAEMGFRLGLFQALVAVLGTLALLVTIRQAIRANAIAREASFRSQRAWISTDLVIEGPLQWHHGEVADVHVAIKIKNTGPTPALNVHTNVAMSFELSNTRKAVSDFSEPNRVRNADWGRICLPGESYLRKWAPGEKADTSGYSLNILIIGCVTYDIQGDDAIHQTQFAYILERMDGRFEMGADVDQHNLKYSVWSGGHAD